MRHWRSWTTEMDSLLLALVALQGADGLPVAPERSSSKGVLDAEGAAMTDEEKAQLHRRIVAVREYERSLLAGRRVSFLRLAAKHGLPEWKLRELWRKFDRDGESALQHNLRPRGSRLPEQLLDAVKELHYQPRKRTATEIFEHPKIVALRRDLGVRCRVRRIRDFIASLAPSRAEDAVRAGRRRAPRAAYRGSIEWQQRIVIPFQQLQTDLFEIDAFLLSSDGRSLLPRPWLLCIFDVASRLPVRWRICVRRATEQDYLKTIASALTPPRELCARLGLDPATYPIYGVPQLIVADNGWEFISRRAHDQLLEIGTDAAHAAEFEASMKGFVERFQRTLNLRFVHRLPGTTKSGKEAIKTSVAMVEARRHGLRIDEFERHFGRWLIGSYAHFAHTELDNQSPFDRWHDLVMRYGRPTPWPDDEASRLKLELMWLRRSSKTHSLDPRGYHIFNRYYLPEQDDLPDDAWLLFDPDDVRKIHIEDPRGGYHGIARAASLRGARPISLEELKSSVSPFDSVEQAGAEDNANTIFTEIEAIAHAPRAAAKMEHQIRARDEIVRRRRAESAADPLPEAEDLNFDLDGDA